MSIRPVDMQVVIQKTQEVHQAKQTVVSKMDNELVHAQLKTKADNIKSQHTVHNTERSEMRHIKNDEETTDERKRRKQKEHSLNQEQSDRELRDHDNELNRKVSKAGARFDMKV